MNRLAPTLRALSFFAILTLGAGCAGDQDEPLSQGGSGGEPRAGGTAVLVETADLSLPVAIIGQTVLDVSLAGDVLSMELLRGAWRDGRLVYQTADESPMAIARDYEYFGADSASIRFHMRSDVRWSDGTPLTAGDVAYTYSILDDPGLASPLQQYMELLESVEVEDDSTVVFHFTRRHPEMLTHSAVPIIPEHLFGDTPPGELRNHPAVQDPAGGRLVVSGPFIISRWDRGQQIVLERNPEFQPAALLDQIVLRIIPEPATQLIELQTGGVDMVQRITLDQIPMLRQQAPNVRLERQQMRFYDFVGYNGEQFEPFADREIRRALGLASDREGILRALQMDEFAVPAGGPYPPIFADLYNAEGQAPLPFEPAEARRILESKGWRDSDADGVLDRDGQPFRFQLLLNTGNQRRADVAQILQSAWSDIGVAAEIQTIEFNTLNEMLVRGDFEAVLYGWAVGLTPDISSIWAPDSPLNFTRYDNPDVVELMNLAQRQPSAEAAAPYWREAAAQIVDDQPYTWLYYMDSVDGLSNRLQGVQIDTYGAYQNTWEWWIDSE